MEWFPCESFSSGSATANQSITNEKLLLVKLSPFLYQDVLPARAARRLARDVPWLICNYKLPYAKPFLRMNPLIPNTMCAGEFWILEWGGEARLTAEVTPGATPMGGVWGTFFRDDDGGVPPMSVPGPAAPGNAESRYFHENRNFSQKVLNFMKST